VLLECSLFEGHLYPLGNHLLELLASTKRFTAGDIENHVLAHARPRMQRAWVNCSVHERLALYHLARNHCLNPQNAAVIEQLLRKRLITLRPDPQLASEALRRFILGAETRQLFERWSQDAQTGIWQTLRVPLFVVLMLLVAWMAYSAGDVFKAASAVLAGTLGFLGQAVRAMSFVRGGSGGDDK